MPQVALSADFLKAFSRIPRNQQKKVRAFLDKFRADPTSSAINYEPISTMRDSKVRTVRIDKAYRGVVIHPPKGDVYLMVWVDHHDEASPFLSNVATKSVLTFKTKHRTKLDPQTGKETTRAFHAPVPNESELLALIEAATK